MIPQIYSDSTCILVWTTVTVSLLFSIVSSACLSSCMHDTTCMPRSGCVFLSGCDKDDAVEHNRMWSGGPKKTKENKQQKSLNEDPDSTIVT